MHNRCLGQIFTFKASASRELAGVPATVVAVWPRFRSGDYLVTLEFVQAVKYGNELLTQIDAFASELEPIAP
ncbi:MAG TPA: hypothetical protein VLA19_08015 [Herpetosiphonaceae bacterium]|nr:hypothetical protein [Herpetosiphonaceae bacterium]